MTLKTLSDSVSINLRKRNYERVSVLCRELLTDYADSINDASIISKLYLADLKQDTGSSRMSELKSFLESYILNNPEKEMMVRQAFYFIQKCKVSLGLYESAMTGFQQIINQFPYSYEGLLASWDYAATSLLNSQGGSGGGAIASSKYDYELREKGVISYIDDPSDVYDSRKFSTDDRKTLNDNLTKTFSSQVNKQTREIKSLEEKVTKNEATNSEKKKYQEMRTLKEIIKARKPETIAGHVSMISDDLSRIMKSTSAEYLDKHEANILPTEFALHQNYPNPFNPATKISFDLPQDSKVTLIVYDLLGREVKRLVNNEFKVAGKYTYDFNAASLSSGVYFYRLETEGFVNTKRMMLIK
ncbi:MAG: T9SS type A sorting domain-containing protein [Ignavibacteria bacterium]|nr:T9SS type A sorting domain-containing protein [Ignavibacteria bacterium]